MRSRVRVEKEKNKITGPKMESTSKKLLTFSALLHKTISKSTFKSEMRRKRKRNPKKDLKNDQLHQKHKQKVNWNWVVQPTHHVIPRSYAGIWN